MELSYKHEEVVWFISHYLYKNELNDALERLDEGFYPDTYIFPNGLTVSKDFVCDVTSNIDFYVKNTSQPSSNISRCYLCGSNDLFIKHIDSISNIQCEYDVICNECNEIIQSYAYGFFKLNI